VDPLVDATGQPYAYTGDDPVNATDSTGRVTDPACTGGGPIGATPAEDRQMCAAGQQAIQSEEQQINPCPPPPSRVTWSFWNSVVVPSAQAVGRGTLTAVLDISTAADYATTCALGAAWGGAVGTLVEPGGGTVVGGVLGCGAGVYATYENFSIPPNLPGPDG
jgi:hypothetical protein